MPLAIILVLVSACAKQRQIAPNPHALQNAPPGFTLVPKPDPRVFSQFNSLGDWTNPFLVVHPDGVELIPRDGDVRGPHRTVAELERVLMSLPAEAWPLGRAVAVQENALGSGSEQERTLVALKAMLESHDIAINWWPTA